MKAYLLAGAGVILIGIVLLFGVEYGDGARVEMAEERAVLDLPLPDLQRVSIAVDGVIVKDGPHLKPDTWYVVVEDEGTEVAVELLFDDESICKGRTLSGPCNPDIFIKGRKAYIKGVVVGEVLQVYELTFTVPLTK